MFFELVEKSWISYPHVHFKSTSHGLCYSIYWNTCILFNMHRVSILVVNFTRNLVILNYFHVINFWDRSLSIQHDCPILHKLMKAAKNGSFTNGRCQLSNKRRRTKHYKVNSAAEATICKLGVAVEEGHCLSAIAASPSSLLPSTLKSVP